MPKSDYYTYRELLAALQELSEDQLDMTASTYDPNTHEVVPISETFVVGNLPIRHQIELDGVVENDQPVLVLGLPDGIDALELLPGEVAAGT